MEERMNAIVFSDDELERILGYKEQAGAMDARVAVLNAISVASDRLEFKDDVVVRCKDCKYGKEPILPYRKNCVWCERIQRHISNDWFCADCKRRADG